MKIKYIVCGVITLLLGSCSTSMWYPLKVKEEVDLMEKPPSKKVIREKIADYIENTIEGPYNMEQTVFYNKWLEALNSLAVFIGDTELTEINILVQAKAELWKIDQLWVNELSEIPLQKQKNGLRLCIVSSRDFSLALEHKRIPQQLVSAKPGRSLAAGMFGWGIKPEIFVRETSDLTSLARGLTLAHEGRHWMYFRELSRKMKISQIKFSGPDTEIDAYLFQNKITSKLGGDEYTRILERKIKSFRKGAAYNPNCLNVGDLENGRDLYDLFCEDIGIERFNTFAYLTYMTRLKNSKQSPKSREKIVRELRNYSQLYLCDLRTNCSHIAPQNPNH